MQSRIDEIDDAISKMDKEYQLVAKKMSDGETRTKYVIFQILKKINDGPRAKFMNRSAVFRSAVFSRCSQ